MEYCFYHISEPFKTDRGLNTHTVLFGISFRSRDKPEMGLGRGIILIKEDKKKKVELDVVPRDNND